MPNKDTSGEKEKTSEKEEKKRIKPVIEEIGEEELGGKETEEVKVDEEKAGEPEESEEESEEESVTQEESEPKKSNFKAIFFTALISAVVTAALGGGIYVYSTGASLKSVGQEVQDKVTRATPAPTPIPTPTPTPEPVIDAYSVSVLNGSGTVGAAGEAEDLLTKAGFDVTNTGNAKTFDFEETVIQVKGDVPQAVIDKLEEVLSESYSVTTGEALEETSTYDIVVTVGSK
jgi:hypothetical protein